MNLNDKIRKAGQDMSDQRDDHMMETGHTNFSLVQTIISTSETTVEFYQECLDCKESFTYSES